MKVTLATKAVAITGLCLALLLSVVQLIAVFYPQDQWTIDNIYGGAPPEENPEAYFAFNQGYAYADAFFWCPLQIVGSIGMLAGGQKWGFLLALMGSMPFMYSGITIFVWDRDMGIRENTFLYWVIIWGMWPKFGVWEAIYLFIRLMSTEGDEQQEKSSKNRKKD